MVRRGHASGLDYVWPRWQQAVSLEENLHIAYVSSALRLMYSKTAKAAMHEIPCNAKPTFSSASVISETAAVFFFCRRFFLFGRLSVLLRVRPPREPST